MPSIIAYAFDSDIHCPDCTMSRFKEGGFYDNEHDNNGISIYARDQDGNFVQPIFDTDELIDGAFCADCNQFIK